MPESLPELSVVVLSWNTKDYLNDCLSALRKCQEADGLTPEIIVIDNASHDGSPDMVAEQFPEVRLVRNPDNRGYAIGVNQGVKLARGKRVCLLGSDTRVRPGTWPALISWLDQHPDAGVVAPPLLNADGSYQSACMRFPSLLTVMWWDTPLGQLWPDSKELRRYQMKDWDHHGTRQVDQPPGTCFMVPRKVIDKVGLMDERLWLFYNDVDWSLRIKRSGFKLWYVDCPGVFHHEGGSTRNYGDFAAEWHRNRITYYRKHHHLLGVFLTKLSLVYVGVRQCVRIRRELGFTAECKQHCKELLGHVRKILFSAPR